MTARNELTGLSAAALAAAVRALEVSPLEVVEAHLERIDAVNPALNAIVTLRREEALREAREAERALLGGDVGPLHGVPFTVKDVIATRGVRTTCGSRLLADHVPRADATAVARLKEAGAILLGKTNCSEFALNPLTANPLFGETGSPLGAVTPGGSSGGESAAIAAGCSPLGLGTDYGGSLRWPAHCTGIGAIRPTIGRVPGTGQLPAPAGTEPAPPNGFSFQGRIQVVGPLARTVDDLELALGILSGPDDLDSAAVPARHRSAREVDPLVLGYAWCAGEGSLPVRPDLVAAVERAAGRLEQLGARVDEERPDALDGAAELYSRLRRADGLHDLRRAVAGREQELGDELRATLAAAGEGSAAELDRLWAERDALRARFLGFLAAHPVLLLPVAALPAYSPAQGPPAVDGIDLSPFDVLTCCRVISLFGVPAAAVPCGVSAEGLPVAVQVVGRPFCEHEVLAVARVLEQELGGQVAAAAGTAGGERT